MTIRRWLATALLLCAYGLPCTVCAADFGPRRDVGQIRSDARRLLAQRVRSSGVDPQDIAIVDVAVVADQALLSWSTARQRGVMGLVRYLDRWWDALDVTRDVNGTCARVVLAYPLDGDRAAERISSRGDLIAYGFSAALAGAAEDRIAELHEMEATRGRCPNTDIAPDDRAILPAGGMLRPLRGQTSGYAIVLRYAANDAASQKFSLVYARAPTRAEMLSNPPPPRAWGGATDVFYFDLMVGSPKAVSFGTGSTLDVWFPFVLDDELRYRFSFVSAGTFSQPIAGRLFDNVLHFELPAFSISPGQTFQSEIDGWW